MKKISIVLLVIFINFAFSVNAQEPTRWRGPDQNGYYPDKGLLKEWPQDGPAVLWQNDRLGIGYSSPAFGNERIYVSGMEGEIGYIYALEQDGKLIWKAPYGKEFSSSYPGSRGTPVIDGDYLYILSGLGQLSCLSSNSGQLLWTKDLFGDFGGRNTQWGITETLLVVDEKLICTPGGREHNVIALNKVNGEMIWSSQGLREVSAYCSPLLVEIGGRDLMITHTADHIIGLDLDDGELLWSYEHTNRYSVHPNTPLYHDGQVFCFSGYGKGGVMLQLNDDGSKVSKMWFSETMDSRIGGAVYLNGNIIGSGDQSREWQCIDWATGELKYETKEVGNGVVIAADDMLYFYSQRGELALVQAGPASFRVISNTRISAGSGQHWAHPVINQGRLFVRHGDTLIAYRIR